MSTERGNQMDIIERINEVHSNLMDAHSTVKKYEETIMECSMCLTWAEMEIEQLREALRKIHGLGDTPDDSWKAYQICCKALGEDE
jgi:DNA repair ATPase RecN